MTPHALLLAALLAVAAPLGAETRRYELDPVHSRIVFLVSHAGFSRAIGTFSGVEGVLEFDESDWRGARVEARIRIDSLELGDAKWRERILDPTFFDAGRHPEARFVSTRVEPAGDGRLRVTGNLELRGERREVVLDVTINRIDRHPLTLRGTAGFSARTQLSRAAFGMQKWKNLVGDEVELMIEVEALRRRGARGERGEED
jgi:polyisoprenoid-binding protein YceI